MIIIIIQSFKLKIRIHIAQFIKKKKKEESILHTVHEVHSILE